MILKTKQSKRMMGTLKMVMQDIGTLAVANEKAADDDVNLYIQQTPMKMSYLKTVKQYIRTCANANI